jgi:hypothetical protein
MLAELATQICVVWVRGDHRERLFPNDLEKHTPVKRTSIERGSAAARLSHELANENRLAAGLRRPFLKRSLFRFPFAKKLIEEEETTRTKQGREPI